MAKTVKLKKPEKNIIYTIAMPPTGKLVRYKFIKEIYGGQRLAFQNVDIKNVETFTPGRFSYLLSYCLVEKEKISEQPSPPSATVSEK